jgi:hypothetical protein
MFKSANNSLQDDIFFKFGNGTDDLEDKFAGRSGCIQVMVIGIERCL